MSLTTDPIQVKEKPGDGTLIVLTSIILLTLQHPQKGLVVLLNTTVPPNVLPQLTYFDWRFILTPYSRSSLPPEYAYMISLYIYLKSLKQFVLNCLS